MARVKVQPANDGHNMRGNWEVVGRGKVEGYTKKKTAMKNARRIANDGDTLVIKRTNGTIQDTRTVQKGRGGSKESGDTTGGEDGRYGWFGLSETSNSLTGNSELEDTDDLLGL